MKFTKIAFIASSMLLGSAFHSSSNKSNGGFSNGFHRARHRIHNRLKRVYANTVRNGRTDQASLRAYYFGRGSAHHAHGHDYGSLLHPYH